jgi:hypothetical protein
MQLVDVDDSEHDVAADLGHEKASTAESTYIHCFDRPATEERIRQAMERAWRHRRRRQPCRRQRQPGAMHERGVLRA